VTSVPPDWLHELLDCLPDFHAQWFSFCFSFSSSHLFLFLVTFSFQAPITTTSALFLGYSDLSLLSLLVPFNHFLRFSALVCRPVFEFNLCIVSYLSPSICPSHMLQYTRLIIGKLNVCVFGCCRQNRQMKSKKSATDVERLKPMNGSIDSYSMNLSATNDDVTLQWHQQQRQQLVM